MVAGNGVSGVYPSSILRRINVEMCPCGCGNPVPGKKERAAGSSVPVRVGVAIRTLEGIIRPKECRKYFMHEHDVTVEEGDARA